MREVIQGVLAAEAEAKTMLQAAQQEAEAIIQSSRESAAAQAERGRAEARAEAARIIDAATAAAAAQEREELSAAESGLQAELRLDPGEHARAVRLVVSAVTLQAE